MAKKNINNSQTLIKQVEELFKLNKTEESLKILEIELRSNPNNWQALNYKGCCYLKRKNYPEALANFERALEIDESQAESWGCLGTYYLLKKDISGADVCFKKVEGLEENELSNSQIAFYLYTIEDYEKSQLYVDKTLSINSDNESALNTKGLLLIKKEEYQDAINIFKTLIKNNVSNSMYHSNLGHAYHLKNKINEARKELKKSISLDPSNAYAYNNLAILYHSQSDYKTAWTYAESATSIESDISIFWQNKAEILISLIKSGEQTEENLEYVGYCLMRGNISAVDAISALNLSDIQFSKHEMCQIIRGMINMDIFYSETTRNCQVDKDSYLNIYQISLEIVALLNASEVDELEFAHYTTQETANTLIFNNSPFRLNSVTTANDPKEGYPLLNFIGFTGSYSPNIYQAFVGSFTFNPDSLNQFRLYGKNNNIEGSGMSLILSFNYFADDININNSLVNPFKITTTKIKQPLFRCVYLDPISRRVISLGHKEACVFYRENLNKTKDKIDEQVDKYLNFINDLKVKVEEGLNSLNSEVHNIFNKVQNDPIKHSEAIRLIPLLLIHIRYLVKHYDFKEEQECRIIQVEPLINNSRIKISDDNSRMYVNYLPFHKDSKTYLKSMYSGPRTSNFELLKDRVTQLGLNIYCIKNDHPFV